MIILDGKKTAEKLNEALAETIKTLERKPRLDIVLIGDHPASLSYVKSKIKTSFQLGMEAQLHHLAEDVSHQALETLIKDLNNDQYVDGILLQLPIPKHLDEQYFVNLIDYTKDVDGFHTMNQGKLFQKQSGIRPATPEGIMMLLKAYDIKVEGLHAVVVGRSQIVGAPIAKMLLDQNATVTITHSKTKNLAAITKQADILIAAIGKPLFITADMVKEGVIVIDVGINRVDGQLVGDVDFEHVSQKSSYITPVPKGVGPMTICALGYNLVRLYQAKEEKHV